MVVITSSRHLIKKTDTLSGGQVAELHDLVNVFWPIIEPATIKAQRFKEGKEPT